MRTLRCACLIALAAPAVAQNDYNIDVGHVFGVPGATFDGAAGVPGIWNEVTAYAGTKRLVKVDGTQSGASISTPGGWEDFWNAPGTSGDVELLMDDLATDATALVYRIQGLPAGEYDLYIYANSPVSADWHTQIEVEVDGYAYPTRSIGGVWNGVDFVAGVTHTVHRLALGAGARIDITGTPLHVAAGINGFQLIEVEHPAFCSVIDGALDLCPCSNAGAPDRGCDNSQGTGGVRLDVVGQDTDTLSASLVSSGYSPIGYSTTILVRGNDLEGVPVPFGDGLRCVGLRGFVRVGATIFVAGQALHAVSHGAGAGTFYYQARYRNSPPTFCVTTGPSSGRFNLSSGRALTW